LKEEKRSKQTKIKEEEEGNPQDRFVSTRRGWVGESISLSAVVQRNERGNRKQATRLLPE
jgi:hypothetical protein